MSTNKWVKWVTGLGSVAVFTACLRLVNEPLNDPSQLQRTIAEEVNEQREKQLIALDWEEGNWDVQYSKEAIIVTPKEGRQSLPPAENRTRRS
ncbi:hypothetical protein CS060_06965 [Anoxybacillus flavithermus]|uniref:Uncharacterized protein n=1 Tax=Anoxybacillus flavithermus TaxID=33934 RepID=A0A2G5RQR7_9BACL|nr:MULTISPECIES: hypothetical protein [Anoxybacillus]KFZ43048.1 hypothetical protein JS80_05640 [Anoxybacillus sp. KU2-6(11)]PIC05001.1 hypothetical protein CS060_06965 [Anoxybacillus flavithermus]